ncbi:MAG: glycosyltransferase family 39 protein [Acidobacteria bacterium]|nr:glycosyltransferase family 39 protein [Acidobacteriota bacterium]
MSLVGPRFRIPLLTALALTLLALLLLNGLSGVGLLGPDEPRYASIGREMARSGDWVTPRLWGQPWFEKPPLLYWLVALGRKSGLGDDLAPRVPLVLLSVAFLAFQFFALRRLYDDFTASTATLVLATTAGWTAYTQVAVTDLPLAVTFTAALLCGMLWMQTASRTALYATAVFFGLSLLAKGLVPAVLALPFLWLNRRQWRSLLLPAAAALLIAAPWFAAMLLLHGWAFFDEFFIRHHLSRFTSGGLMHVQPVWFYIPVLVGGLFPWPVLLSQLGPSAWLDRRLRVPALTFAFGFLFFSLSSNKLPGYILPLLPSLAILIAAGSRESKHLRRSLAITALLVGLCPVVVSILPESLLYGIRRAEWGELHWEYFAFTAPLAAAAWWLDARGRRTPAVLLVAALAASGLWYVKHSAAPVLDELVSARGLWRKVQPLAGRTCIDDIHRAWRYGLNYYSGKPLPDCQTEPRPLSLTQQGGSIPVLSQRIGE